jgi:hypothetical protein
MRARARHSTIRDRERTLKSKPPGTSRPGRRGILVKRPTRVTIPRVLVVEDGIVSGEKSTMAADSVGNHDVALEGFGRAWLLGTRGAGSSRRTKRSSSNCQRHRACCRPAPAARVNARGWRRDDAGADRRRARHGVRTLLRLADLAAVSALRPSRSTRLPRLEAVRPLRATIPPGASSTMTVTASR